MGKTIWEKMKAFRPRLVPSVLLSILFGAGALFTVAASRGRALPQWLCYLLYVTAALALGMTIWAAVRLFRSGVPQKIFTAAMHRFALTGRMQDDLLFRILVFAYLSAGANIVFAIVKGVAGWLSASVWLIAFAGYYLVLCVAKLMLLSAHRQLAKLPALDRTLREWKAYRLCGLLLLLLLTLLLQGVVVMIVGKGNGFTYVGQLIFVMAIYDFYCLIASICYIIKNRKIHAPVIVAIKLVSFAASLVSMLSLQTAMFAAFGPPEDGVTQSGMNLATDTGVCLLVFALSLFMLVHSCLKIRDCKQRYLQEEQPTV